MVERCPAPTSPGPLRGRGLSLVELTVALAVGLGVVTLCASSLAAQRRSQHHLEARLQLHDNARLASALLRRVLVQTGYTHTAAALARRTPSQATDYEAEPHLKAFNNAQYRQALAIGTSTSISSSQRGVNGSDLLVVRYQPEAHGSDGASDHSMVNCQGHAEPWAPADWDERLFSVFHISTHQGEPTLMCTYRNEVSGQWVTQPLVSGVETLQILLGTRGVDAGRAPSNWQPPTEPRFVEQLLRPDQLLVSGNSHATHANWARVHSVHVGMVLRGPPGSASPGAPSTHYAFGTPWLCHSADTGCALSTGHDGRLRHSVRLVVHLRNPPATP